MKAIQVEEGRLRWRVTPAPELGEHDIRIAVHATACNRADLVQRAGAYPPPPGASEILGLECAGEVTEVGAAVTAFESGDLCCALLSGGGYAEEVVVPAVQALPVPKGLSMTEAAALPEVFATAWLNLYREARLEPGERVLLHAGASGVGTAALQLCRMTGNPTFVTSGSDEKIARCLEYGAENGWNRHNGSFADAIKDWTSQDGVDVILDPVGASYLTDNLSVLRLDGRLVVIGLMGGVKEEVNLGLMMRKRLRLIGSTLRARPVEAKGVVMEDLLTRVWPAIEAGEIAPVIDTVLPIEEAEEAHALMASNKTVGKIVLSVRAS